MSELREVFDMVTKQTEPDLDTWRQQEQRQRRSNRNRKVRALALVALLGALAAVLVVRSFDDASSVKPATDAVPPAEETEPGLYAVDLTTGQATLIRGVPRSRADASPDGSLIAFGREAGGSSQIFVSNADGTEARRITDDPVEASEPSWSPDASEIAYIGFGHGGTDRSVFVVDVATGRSRQLTFESADAANPAWSPDGTGILYRVGGNSANSVLRLMDVTSGEVTQLTEKGEAAADGAWSPGGAMIVFALDVVGGGIDDSHGIVLMNARSASTLAPMLVRDIPAWRPIWSPDGDHIAYFAEDRGACCNTYVVDVATGQTRNVATGGLFPTWLDNNTLIVEVH